MLQTSATGCIGSSLEKFIVEGSKNIYHLTLNDAAAKSEKTWLGPMTTRISMMDGEDGRIFRADMSVSAWFANDQMFADPFGQRNQFKFNGPTGSGGPSRRNTGPEEFVSPHQMGSSPSDQIMNPLNERRATGALLHEAFYTVSFQPVASSPRRMSPRDIHLSKVEALKEALLHSTENAIMAMSCDGSTVYRNKACDELLGEYEKKDPSGPKITIDEDGNEVLDGDVDVTFISSAMDCFREDFVTPLPDNEFPIYKASVLGEVVEPMLIGLINPVTFTRKLIEISARPMRDFKGMGELIGGVITFRDVTDEKAQKRRDVQAKGEEYFKMICNTLPQLVWTTYPDGYHDWYSDSWYEYTGASRSQSQGVGWQGLFHPDDMIESSRVWSHSLRTGELYSVEYRCRRRDGAWRWMLGRAQPLRDADGNIIKWIGKYSWFQPLEIVEQKT